MLFTRLIEYTASYCSQFRVYEFYCGIECHKVVNRYWVNYCQALDFTSTISQMVLKFLWVCPHIWHVCVILICSDLMCILSSALFLLPFPHCIHLQPESNSIINSHMSQSNFSPFCTHSICLLTPCLPVHSPSHSLHSYLSHLCSFLTIESIFAIILVLTNETLWWCSNISFSNKYFLPAYMNSFHNQL